MTATNGAETSGSTDLNQTRGHNKANEITSASSWATPVHDRAGNMTTVPKPSSLANGLTLKYDAWNRLVEVKDGQTIVGKYEYDGQNRRIKKHIDSQSPASPNGIDRYEHFFYNFEWQILETRDTTTVGDQAENLQPKYQYAWSARYIDAPVLRDKNTDADGLCDDERLYCLGDANYNVTALLDTSGDALERYLYDAYGQVTIYDGMWSNSRSSSNYSVAHLYTGRQLDGESGVYSCRNRYYGLSLGRFLSRDPAEDRSSLYAYCGGSPANATDPSGMHEMSGYPEMPGTPIPGHKGSVIFGGDCLDPNKAGGSIFAIRAAIGKSCDCFDKAKYLLENYTAAINDYFAQTVTTVRFMRVPSNRAVMIAMLKRAQAGCEDPRFAGIRILCERCCERGVDAYVNFLGFANVVSDFAIHICPSFFQAGNDRQEIIMHEMGRYFNSLGEQHTGTWADVYVWDNVLRALCSNYDLFINNYPKDWGAPDA